MKFCWHGSASFSFILNNQEFIVDPSFSQAEDYGSWYMANLHAPSFERYKQLGNPSYLMITHGHFDHFDLHTVKKLLKNYEFSILGSKEVCSAAKKYFSVREDRLIAIDADSKVDLDGIQITAWPGVHWLTGEEGTKVSEKLAGRPDRYGVMPCGGPMLGYTIESPDGSIYISGDTELEGVPEQEVDVAVMYVGGPAPHPVTKEMTKATIDEDDMVQIFESRIKAKSVIPVHYDFQYLQNIDITTLKARVEATASHPQVLFPPYNTWVDIF